MREVVTDYALPKSERVLIRTELAAPQSPAAAHAAPTFADVFTAYAGYVIGLLRKLGVSASDVEDVAQEVFIAIHRRLPSFEGRSSLKTWVCGICLHRAQDYRRKASRRSAMTSAFAREPALAPPSWAPDLERTRMVARIEQALQQLPEKQLQVFVLYELEGLAMAQVAKAIGCPLFTAYTRLHAARRAFRASFGRAAEEQER